MSGTPERLSAALADRYTIERELGTGGMATVYLAHDIKHDRKVAIKVLRPELAAVLGAERFVQEIKTTANLQHPHILPLFDSGEADGFLYYVMPYVEGETLRDKLDRETQLGIEEAVKITTEVADALDYAHRHNVIHRDIKPENILLHDGRPIVADFGIALAVSAAAGGRMTETGLSLGTPHYMSPEQATAEKDLTSRSDIYSLGAVLYEMLTGDPPHTGSSAQQIIMKIVTDEARPVTDVRKSVPPHVAAATTKSLEKLAADRFGTAAQFSEALLNPAFTLSSKTSSSVQPEASYRRSRWLTAIVFVMLATIAIWGWLRRPSQASHDVARYLAVAESEFLDGSPMLLPDGSAFLFVARVRTGSRGAEAGGILTGDARRLYRRRVDELEATALTATAGLGDAAISPDGRWIAFTRAGQLYRTALDGGPATLIEIRMPVAGGIRWLSPDSVAVASRLGIFQIGVGGGAAMPYGVVDTSRMRALWPQALPEGRGVLVTLAIGDIEEPQLAVLTSDGSEPKMLIERGTYARYARNGYLVFARSDGSLHAATFDLERLEVTGLAVPVLGGVAVGRMGRRTLASPTMGRCSI